MRAATVSACGSLSVLPSIPHQSDVSRWLPHADPRTAAGDLTAAARMHKAVTVMMLKLEAQVIARNPDFDLQGRDFLNHIDFDAGTVDYFGTTYPLLDCDFPTVDPARPTVLTADEGKVIAGLVRSFAESERLQRHVQFLYAHGAFYKMCNGNLLYHGAVPMTENGAFAAIRFEGTARSGKRCSTTATAAPARVTARPRAALHGWPDRTFCGTCGAGQNRRCLAAAP